MPSSARLPVIVGFGGFNAAGRSSGHNAYKRMIFDSLPRSQQAGVVRSLSSLMGKIDCENGVCLERGHSLDENRLIEMSADILQGTLVRKIESNLFNVNQVPFGSTATLKASESAPVRLKFANRDLPSPLPYGWTVVHEEKGVCEVDIWKTQNILLDTHQVMPVQSAGQLPSGFNPGAHYRSTHHPRGLQLNILAASDAVNASGLAWDRVLSYVAPDQVGVFSSSVMSQLDPTGLGGMMKARTLGNRVTSKQLALGLNTMPADFVNAYVLGSVGVTGGVTGACATFLYNLRAGVEEIKSGKRRVVLVGSSEAPILPEIIDGYAAMSALATDDNLRKLTGSSEVDHRRASRPFGENCGFTLGESGQYVMLMDDELALELGAHIYGVVPAVYVNADGFKKSISAPGPGNYVTMAKAVAFARNILGDDSVRHRSFLQAHGSSTPHNRVTESRIFDRVAHTFGIESWPLAAVKSYLGHSLGPAGGDQMAASLGVFAHGILPGIKTIDAPAEDIYDERLNISNKDIELGVDNAEVAFLNSKGFGGNNATAAVFSPNVGDRMLRQRHGENAWKKYLGKREATLDCIQTAESQALDGNLNAIYHFGTNMVDEERLELSTSALKVPGYDDPIALGQVDGFEDLVSKPRS